VFALHVLAATPSKRRFSFLSGIVFLKLRCLCMLIYPPTKRTKNKIVAAAHTYASD